jgi:hypothetical protein
MGVPITNHREWGNQTKQGPAAPSGLSRAQLNGH